MKNSLLILLILSSITLSSSVIEINPKAFIEALYTTYTGSPYYLDDTCFGSTYLNDNEILIKSLNQKIYSMVIITVTKMMDDIVTYCPTLEWEKTYLEIKQNIEKKLNEMSLTDAELVISILDEISIEYQKENHTSADIGNLIGYIGKLLK
jgi:hypothetical protein